MSFSLTFFSRLLDEEKLVAEYSFRAFSMCNNPAEGDGRSGGKVDPHQVGDDLAYVLATTKIRLLTERDDQNQTLALTKNRSLRAQRGNRFLKEQKYVP